MLHAHQWWRKGERLMPLGDVTYQNAALDALVASWPATGATYRLYYDDPALATAPGDVELAAVGGYAPAAFAPSDWAAATGGAISTTAAVPFGTSTAAYSDTATFWAVIDGSGLIVWSDSLDDPIAVDGSGTAISFTPTLAFADGD